jgi:hypothetical protein
LKEKRPVKRIYSENDPYGKEWEDTNETKILKTDFFINNKDLSKKNNIKEYLNENFRGWIKLTILQRDGKINQRVLKIFAYDFFEGSFDNHLYKNIYLRISSELIFGRTIQNYKIMLSMQLSLFEKFTITKCDEVFNRKFTDDDPYGEEDDWDFNENKLKNFNDFKINEGKIGRGVTIALMSLLSIFNTMGQPNSNIDKNNVIELTKSDLKGISDSLNTISEKLFFDIKYLYQRTNNHDFYVLSQIINDIQDGSKLPFEPFEYHKYVKIIELSNKLINKYNRFFYRPFKFESIKELKEINKQVEKYIEFCHRPIKIEEIDTTSIDYYAMLKNYEKVSYLYQEISKHKEATLSKRGEQGMLNDFEASSFYIVSTLILISIFIVIVCIIKYPEIKRRRQEIEDAEKIRKARIREKTKDIDPYEEENWEEEIKESLSYNGIKVGRRVKVARKFMPNPYALSDPFYYDTIVYIDFKNKLYPAGNISVEFDESVGGHNCNGYAKDNHGWNFGPQEIDSFVEDEDRTIGVKLYKDGKLVKEQYVYEEMKKEIGKKVKINSGSEYFYQAHENGGDGIGSIVDIEIDEFYVGGLPYVIIWNNGNENSYRRSDFSFIDEEEDKTIKVKWFKGGKLVKETVEEKDWAVGNRIIHINNPKLGIGVIKEVHHTFAMVDFENHKGWACAKNSDQYKILDDDKTVGIKWFKGGKLVKESKIKSFLDFRNL